MKRLLGIDVGEARIGLALSDELGMLAHPLETVRVKTPQGSQDTAAIRHVAEVAAREGVETVVIGLPRHMNGTEGPATAKVRAFAQQLQRAAAAPLALKFWDERLTTVAAQKQLREAGRNAKNSRAVIDQAAAVLILQGYLDSLAGWSGEL